MDLPSKHVRFTHTPLDFKNKEIRLITIQPSSDPSGPIQINMKNVDFSERNNALTRYREEIARLHDYPPFKVSKERDRAVYDHSMQATFNFIALSYTWGPELPAQDILVTSPECRGWLSVRQNLYEFLRTKRDWLSVRQNIDDFLEIGQNLDPASFWIDQICINQGKNDEKAHQVSQMADIYSTASVVEVWLGSGFEGSDELVDLVIYESDLSYQSSSPMLSKSERERLDRELRSFVPSLRQFIRLPYWSRVWITQEIVLGRVVQLRIGPKTLSWDTFYPGWLKLERAWNRLRETEKHEDLETKEGKGLFRLHEINSSRGKKYQTWDSVSRLLWGTECEDPRDRVFGVMGMLHPSLRVLPDYSMRLQDILLELLTRQVVVACNESTQKGARFHGIENEHWIRKDCVRTAVTWFPQLEGHGSMIDPKSVRRHILEITPLTPSDWCYGTWRLSLYAKKVLPNALSDHILYIRCRILLEELVKPGYKIGRAWQLQYYIWKNIPNERNKLWRIVRKDYHPLVPLSDFVAL